MCYSQVRESPKQSTENKIGNSSGLALCSIFLITTAPIIRKYTPYSCCPILWTSYNLKIAEGKIAKRYHWALKLGQIPRNIMFKKTQAFYCTKQVHKWERVRIDTLKECVCMRETNKIYLAVRISCNNAMQVVWMSFENHLYLILFLNTIIKSHCHNRNLILKISFFLY